MLFFCLLSIFWRRKWQSTPVFLPGKFHRQRNLVGYSPWGLRVGHNWATKHSTAQFRIGLCKGDKGLPGWCSGKESACQCMRCKRCGFNPWVGKIPEVENGTPFQYSCLENSIDRGAWWATVLGVSESDMTEWLSTHTRVIKCCEDNEAEYWG